jgi:hypothetical protein
LCANQREMWQESPPFEMIRRGCQLVTKPAYTWLNPVTKFLLRRLLPAHYARIRGEPANGMAVDAHVDSRTDAPDQRGAVS